MQVIEGYNLKEYGNVGVVKLENRKSLYIEEENQVMMMKTISSYASSIMDSLGGP
jgi:hypothetical protein